MIKTYNVVFSICVWLMFAMAVLCLMFGGAGHKELSHWAFDCVVGLLASLLAAGWVGTKIGYIPKG